MAASEPRTLGGSIVLGARALAASALDWLAPRGCAACDASLARRAIFCAACAATVERHGADAGAFPAGALYAGAVADAIARLKYGGRADVGAALGELLLRVDLAPFDLVVPVPLHPLRLAERGFNQAALLARPLVRTGARFAPRALRRTRPTSQQTRLSRVERLENVACAFAASSAVRGARVVIVDDVVTTGATLSACCDAARDAGARSAFGVAVAAAPDGHFLSRVSG
ncbi:MAG TPA: phosphoribosyltransferase family protein [Byssovorax sp.]|jgi:ComF family protein